MFKLLPSAKSKGIYDSPWNKFFNIPLSTTTSIKRTARKFMFKCTACTFWKIVTLKKTSWQEYKRRGWMQRCLTCSFNKQHFTFNPLICCFFSTSNYILWSMTSKYYFHWSLSYMNERLKVPKGDKQKWRLCLFSFHSFLLHWYFSSNKLRASPKVFQIITLHFIKSVPLPQTSAWRLFVVDTFMISYMTKLLITSVSLMLKLSSVCDLFT